MPQMPAMPTRAYTIREKVVTLVKFEIKKPDEKNDSEAQTDNNIEIKAEVKDVVSE